MNGNGNGNGGDIDKDLRVKLDYMLTVQAVTTLFALLSANAVLTRLNELVLSGAMDEAAVVRHFSGDRFVEIIGEAVSLQIVPVVAWLAAADNMMDEAQTDRTMALIHNGVLAVRDSVIADLCDELEKGVDR